MSEKTASPALPYSQWFALLTLKHFSPLRASRIVRPQTLRCLQRKGWASALPDGSFAITKSGIKAEKLPLCRGASR